MAEHNPFPGENNTGHIWDDNLRELANPPPRWWMIALWASIVWFFVYGFLYPFWPMATSATKGILGWTQIGEYNEGLQVVEEVRKPFEDKIAGMSAKEVLADPGLTQYVMASGKVLFGDKCAACHGNGGQGNPGFPVLADDDWLYGGDIDTLVTTVTNGRKGVMNAHGKILKPEEIDRLAQFVVNRHAGQEDADGMQMFTQKGCIACHGMDAKGLKPLGSANLTDSIWRFEPGGIESARYTITHGVNDPNDPKTRNAEMPAFGKTGRVTPDEIKKLAVYVHQLGGGQ